jgi:hypothetical protein
MQTVNVGWASSVTKLISFTVCPEPHCGCVQEESSKLIGRVTFALTRPFLGCRVWLVLVVLGSFAFSHRWGNYHHRQHRRSSDPLWRCL